MKNESIIALPGPDNILRKQFSNGVTVLVHENPWSNSAAICGSVSAGSCLETTDKIGLSSFVSACLTAGTQSGNIRNVGEYLEGIGATLSFTSAPHAIQFKATCLCEDLPELLELLKDIMNEPAFPEHEFEMLKQHAVGRFVPGDDEPDDAAHKLFKEFLWGKEHPYGRLKLGDSEVIMGITRDDLVNYHRRFFGPKQFILSIAGGFHGKEIMDRCEDIFGRWEKAQEETDEEALFPQVERNEKLIRVHMDYPGHKEISLVIGTFGPAVNDQNILSAKLGNHILSEFGTMGRLGQVVRDVHGLAYDISSVLAPWKKGGCWYVEAGIDPSNLAKAGDMILEELKRFIAEPVSLQELEDAKSWWIGSLPQEFVTNGGKAAMIHSLAFYQRDLDYFLRLPEWVNAVTPETILETARKWIDPEKMIIITTGPTDENNGVGW